MRRGSARANSLRPVRRTLVVAVGVLLAIGAASCQKGPRLGVYNACGFAIEVSLNDVSPPSAYQWTRIEDGQRDSGWLGAESDTEFFVWVRAAEGEPVTEFAVAREELSPPPAGHDYDLEIVMEGDRCPATASR